MTNTKRPAMMMGVEAEIDQANIMRRAGFELKTYCHELVKGMVYKIQMTVIHALHDQNNCLPDPAITFEPLTVFNEANFEDEIRASDRKEIWARAWNRVITALFGKKKSGRPRAWRYLAVTGKGPHLTDYELYRKVVTRRAQEGMTFLEKISAEILFLEYAMSRVGENWRPKAVLMHPSMYMTLGRELRGSLVPGIESAFGCRIVPTPLLQPNEYRVI